MVWVLDTLHSYKYSWVHFWGSVYLKRVGLFWELLLRSVGWDQSSFSSRADFCLTTWCLMNYKPSHSGWWSHGLLLVLCELQEIVHLTPLEWFFPQISILSLRARVISTPGMPSAGLWSALHALLSSSALCPVDSSHTACLNSYFCLLNAGRLTVLPLYVLAWICSLGLRELGQF